MEDALDVTNSALTSSTGENESIHNDESKPSSPSTPTKDLHISRNSSIRAPPQPTPVNNIQSMHEAVKYRLCLNIGGSSAVKAKSTKRVQRRSDAVLRRQSLKASTAASAEEDSFTDRSTANSECTFSFPDSAFDDEYEDEADLSNGLDISRRIHTVDANESIYRAACRVVGETPSKYFIKHLRSKRLVMQYHVLGSRGAKACATALTANATIEVLDLKGNELGEEGGVHFAKMISENNFITELTLSENGLGAVGGKHIAEAVSNSYYIRKLDLSGNNFQENDAIHFAEMIKENVVLRELNLGNNSFREKGGEILGASLVDNWSIEVLDLSWNHLRLKGAVAVAKGMEHNTGIRRLDLSWNGFHLDGCRALANMLAHNTTLEELDISSNRIDMECLKELIKGLPQNKTLLTLKMAQNPILTDGAVLLMETLVNPECTALTEIDISGQSVDILFLRALQKVQCNRPLVVHHGVMVRQDMLAQEVEEDFFINDDPIIVLMEFTRLKHLRIVDVFTSMDTDKSWSLSKDEFREGLLKVNIPLSQAALDKLVEKLDKNNDGEVDFSELIAGQKEHKSRVYHLMMQAKENNIPFEDTSIGFISHKIQSLMSALHQKELSSQKAEKQKAIQNAIKPETTGSASSEGGGKVTTRDKTPTRSVKSGKSQGGKSSTRTRSSRR